MTACPPDLAPESRWAARRLDVALLIAGLLLCLFFTEHRVHGDGAIRFDSVQAILRGTIPDGKYSLIGPLGALPLVALGTLAENPYAAAGLYNFAVFAIALFVLWFELGHVLPDSVRRRTLLLLVAGSMFAAHQREFYGEVFTAVLLAVGSVRLVRRCDLSGWLLIGLGIANTPPTIVAGGLLALVLCRQRKSWLPLLGPALPLVLILAEAWIRRGSPFALGYSGDAGMVTVLPYSGKTGFSYPFILGVVSILFSVGKGLLFYVPGLFLSAANSAKPQTRDLWQLWLAFTIGLVVIYAKWWSWYGGWFWGPRFFLFACFPASLALACELDRRKLLAAFATVLSVWVCFCGAVFGQMNAGPLSEVDVAWEFLTWYVPENSAILQPLVDPWPVGLNAVPWALFSLVVVARLLIPVFREDSRA